MRDTKSLLLVLLSVGLVGTWAYHLYDKATASQKTADGANETLAAAVKDSLQRVYNDSIAQLGQQLDSSTFNADSLQFQLAGKLAEIERLKTEIAGIISNRTSTHEDLVLARHKRDELQALVDQLNDHNRSVEDEKQQLSVSLQQITQEADGLQKNVQRLTAENETLTEKVNLASVFVASEMRLSAIDVKSGRETETSKAKNTDKLVASFVVQNNLLDIPNAEAVVVMLQPDGQVLRNNIWDSGSFDTRNNGKKNYTRKIKFDYVKGEAHNLVFTLDVQDCQKGKYTFQLWHKGILVGSVAKTLS